MSGVVHVIGAGLAGLACAVAARQAGLRVSLHEAAPQAGGRCRSFHDRHLDRVIDNGTHLILSGNAAVLNHARVVGGDAALEERPAAFPFVDLADGTRWVVRPGAGRLPWWLLQPSRRVPGSGLRSYLNLMSPWRPTPADTVAGRWGGNALYRRLIEPLSTAILNTEPQAASASLLRTVLDDTLGRGEAACRPVLAPTGLGHALIAPSLAWLRAAGAAIHTSDALLHLEQRGGRISALRFQKARLPLAADDVVVLAVPAAAAHRLLPDVVPVLETRPILNAHFAIPPDAPIIAGPPFIGVVGGLAQWIQVRPGVVSVTVSCPGQAIDLPADILGRRLWRDVVAAMGLGDAGHSHDEPPPFRIIKERRATLAHCPAQEALRPGPRTSHANLWLAGDWVATGLPSTLEGAARSGQWAAECARNWLSAEAVGG